MKQSIEYLLARVEDARKMMRSTNTEEREVGVILAQQLNLKLLEVLGQATAEAEADLDVAIEEFTIIVAKTEAAKSGKPWASC